MNCKPSDRVIVLGCHPDYSEHIGKITTVLCRSSTWPDKWRTALLADGYLCFYDHQLHPIRDPGDDAEDESKAWLPPVPTKETV